ncbi:hypothetical protein Taro_032982, partial [Colocasia esculenta]|nr:hypothetical protein [Colocasia esculenta]
LTSSLRLRRPPPSRVPLRRVNPHNPEIQTHTILLATPPPASLISTPSRPSAQHRTLAAMRHAPCAMRCGLLQKLASSPWLQPPGHVLQETTSILRFLPPPQAKDPVVGPLPSRTRRTHPCKRDAQCTAASQLKLASSPSPASSASFSTTALELVARQKPRRPGPETSMAWWESFLEGGGLGDVLAKVGVFVLVQALVYFILSNSSNVFSATRQASFGLRTVRSLSIRRMLAALADMPAGGETSPPAGPSRTASREISASDGEEEAGRS